MDEGESAPERMRPLAWGLAIAATVLLVRAAPHVLTDGDSCRHAALVRDMSTNGWAPWVAPEWALQGEWTWWREHPPGALWPAALLALLGTPPAVAVQISGALWIFAALAGVVALARRWMSREAAAVAGVVFLLHVPALRYVGRADIHFPFAAATVWSIAAALRLADGRRFAVLLALALGGAFLTRGAFGGVAVVLVGTVVLEPSLRPPLARVATGVAGAAALVLLFDRLHAAVTGESFWIAYAARQVTPSLVEGGTQHNVEGRQFAYFAGRLALYALPWALLPVWRALRGPRWQPSGAPWRVLLVGVAVTYLGASLTLRPASRYLFAAWPLLAVLFALSLPRPVPLRLARVAPWAALCAVPLLVAAARLAARSDAWTRAAEDLQTLAAERRVPAEVRGDFDPQDSRPKSFLRLYLGTRAIGGAPRPGSDAWVVVPAEQARTSGHERLATLPFGELRAELRDR